MSLEKEVENGGWFLKTALILGGLGLIFLMFSGHSKAIDFVGLMMVLLGVLSAFNALRLSKYAERTPVLRVLIYIGMAISVLMLVLWLGLHALKLFSAHFYL